MTTKTRAIIFQNHQFRQFERVILADPSPFNGLSQKAVPIMVDRKWIRHIFSHQRGYLLMIVKDWHVDALTDGIARLSGENYIPSWILATLSTELKRRKKPESNKHDEEGAGANIVTIRPPGDIGNTLDALRLIGVEILGSDSTSITARGDTDVMDMVLPKGTTGEIINKESLLYYCLSPKRILDIDSWISESLSL